ncbi:Probable phytol kinase [Seminavis robusta]|uniref:Probable phytol kinase n=1 Tax=Seminavis robusta TaxID=568900 RepID=A0A9N8H456_9STRA|nr:Probable phytol kinase [Seminavis robusta]|eukprot:Sro54_g031660.1 Probable phytol kinase (238) ;mRNA; f:9253-9966
MDPSVKQNVLSMLATLVYIKVIVGACDWSLLHTNMPSDISRKIIHISACSWCLFWPLFDTSHWTWQLNVAIPFAYSIQLAVKGAIIRDKHDSDVKTMSRTGDPSELLYGPLLFTLIMLFCGLYEFRTTVGTYIMGSLVGDGIAPVVGKRWPIGKYPTMGRNEYKTLSGSLGMFVGCMVGIVCYQKVLGAPSQLDMESVMQIAFLATVAEALTGKWDNPAIAFTVYWFAKATDFTISI